MRWREWINTKAGAWITSLCALGLIGAAVGIWIVRGSATDRYATEVREKGQDLHVICDACGKTGQAHIPFYPTFPVACPHCKEVKAMPAFECVGCKQIIRRQFVPYYRCKCGQVYDSRGGGGGGGQLPEGAVPPDAPPE